MATKALNEPLAECVEELLAGIPIEGGHVGRFMLERLVHSAFASGALEACLALRFHRATVEEIVAEATEIL